MAAKVVDGIRMVGEHSASRAAVRGQWANDRVGLHPLTIIIAIMIGTTLLGGIVGGVLAIPLTAVLRTLMFRYVWVDRVHTSGANS